MKKSNFKTRSKSLWPQTALKGPADLFLAWPAGCCFWPCLLFLPPLRRALLGKIHTFQRNTTKRLSPENLETLSRPLHRPSFDEAIGQSFEISSDKPGLRRPFLKGKILFGFLA